MYSALRRQAITSITFLVFWAVIGSCSSSYRPNNSTLPVVDLGYVKQRATVYNETNDWYIFKNIRFAAPPLGNLRFRKPQYPLRQEGIQNGSTEDIGCYQTLPSFISNASGTISEGVEDCLVIISSSPRSGEKLTSVKVFRRLRAKRYQTDRSCSSRCLVLRRCLYLWR